MGNVDLAVHAPADTTTRRSGRVWTVVSWVLRAGLAVMFVLAGLQKVSGAQPMVDMFETIGAGQWLRVLVGLLEIAGAIGLLVPALCGLAALGLALLMVGATITNIFVLSAPTGLTIVLLVVAAVIAWSQRARIVPFGRRARR